MFISIDPGENVGVATFKEDGGAIAKKVFSLQDFRKFLKFTYFGMINDNPNRNTLKIIYEDYTLRQDMAIAQTGSNMPASRAIGAVEMIHDLLGEKSIIFKSKPSDLRGALKWAGYPHLANKPRSWHCPDDIAAYAHGVKFLIDQGIRRHPIFDD